MSEGAKGQQTEGMKPEEGRGRGGKPVVGPKSDTGGKTAQRPKLQTLPWRKVKRGGNVSRTSGNWKKRGIWTHCKLQTKERQGGLREIKKKKNGWYRRKRMMRAH